MLQELSRDIESTVRAHARDELGIDIEDMANPFEAMLSSFVAFVFGAAFPLFAALPFDDYTVRTACVLGSSCIGLVLLGSVGGFLGGSSALLGASRVFAGGLIAMGITFGVGKMFGVALD